MLIERIYIDAEEHQFEKGFFKHPRLDYWLSKTEARALTNNGFVYPTGKEGRYKTIGSHLFHRLVLETFLYKPKTLKVKIYGNHINGDKHDCRLENLEWVTSQGNFIHALKNNLNKSSHRGLLLDLETREIVSFSSLREVAMYLKLPTGSIVGYLKGKRVFPIKFKYAIWRLGEPKSKLTSKDIGKTSKFSPRPLIISNLKTGEVKYLSCITSLRKELGLSSRKAKRVTRTGKFEDWEIRSPLTYAEYERCVEDDGRMEIAAEKRRLNLSKMRPEQNNFKVSVLNELTGVTEVFDSLRAFTEKHGFKIGEINRALKTKSTWGPYLFKFLE